MQQKTFFSSKQNLVRAKICTFKVFCSVELINIFPDV